MATLAQPRPAAPPTPQEIHRKLSTSRPPKLTPAPPPPQPASGTESDSDSVLTPDLGSPTHNLFSPASLSAIAERRTVSGEETDEEEEEDEGWRVATSAPASSAMRPAAVGDSIRKAGYLWKKGIRRKTWKKRWFVLRLPHLAYYKNSAEYKLLRLLDLHEVHAVAQCALKRHSNAFGVVSPNRTFYLQADTRAEMESWVEALNDARIALQSTATVVSVAPQTEPIAIPAPTTPRANAGRLPSPITPSPPSRLNMHGVTSSDSEEPSPTTPHPAAQFSVPAKTAAGAGLQGQDPTKVVLSGYLMKCASKRKSWRKRWFTLSGEKLVYSASHMDTRPHLTIALGDILDALEFSLPAGRSPPGASSPPAGSGEEQEGSHTFKVITPKRTLVLCAPSEEEEIRWLSAIRAMIARRSGGGSEGASGTGRTG